ncbi:ubiquitin-associated protein 2-like isoform X1 [Pollicipes pollicipes]|nr:ubiquitin-associated protein 2-like isoform X1 [Pollicipes pollicipes]
MADAKYSRQEASSPVQSSLNQQVKSQQQQQFFNAAAIPPNYTYFPFVPQYSIYTPMPPATNAAHQASSTSQYPKMAYNATSFGGSYDSLASAPGGDYKSAGFVGSAGHKLGGSGSVGAAADLSAVYSKMQLGNKYDNKGFHAATPPPFNLAGQAQTTPLAAPGGYAPHMFIQTMPPQHQMVHPGHQDSSVGGPQRAAQPSKAAAKNSYGGGYWPGN